MNEVRQLGKAACALGVVLHLAGMGHLLLCGGFALVKDVRGFWLLGAAAGGLLLTALGSSFWRAGRRLAQGSPEQLGPLARPVWGLALALALLAFALLSAEFVVWVMTWAPVWTGC